MNILGIDYTYFAVRDMQRSLAFYRDLLGIPLSYIIFEDTWAEFEINSSALVLGEGDNITPPGGGTVALAVDDVRSTVEELEKEGVPVNWSPDESPVCYFAVVEDPDGNRIIIHKRKDNTFG